MPTADTYRGPTLTLRIERLCRFVDEVRLICDGPGRWDCEIISQIEHCGMGGSPEAALDEALTAFLVDYPELRERCT